MKTKWLALVLALVVIGSACNKQDAKPGVVLDTKTKKISYMLGMRFAQEVRSLGIPLDNDCLLQGFRDNQAGGKPMLSESDINQVLQEFSKEMMVQRSQKNVQEEDAFLLDNGKKPGVETTASGLQYKVITEGKGPKPKATDTVKVHYRGYTPSGTEFDSSYTRNEPAEFKLDGVIKGWTEVVQLMNVGSKYQVFIPARLAYGEKGAGSAIGPNQMLIFDIELLDINPKPKK